MCYELDDHQVTVMFKVDLQTLLAPLYFFRENLELLVGQCVYSYREDAVKYPEQNITELRRCKMNNRQVFDVFIVRVVSTAELYTGQDEPVSVVSVVVQNGTGTLSGRFLSNLFVYMGKANIDNMMSYAYFTGETYSKKKLDKTNWLNTYWKYIAIGAGGK